MKNGKKIFIDSKGFLNREDLEAKGYKVVSLDIKDMSKSSFFNPQNALLKLVEEDPVKYEKVVSELESIIKNDKFVDKLNN